MIKAEKRKIYWFLIYPVVGLTFVVASIFFILSARGCKITYVGNRIDIERMGMIIVSSKPFGADIFLNGKDLKKKTSQFFSTKIDKKSKGKYTLRVEKEGFYTWEKNLEVLPEMVTWANYVLLFSKNPKIDKMDFSGTVTESIVSQDKKYSTHLLEQKENSIIYLLNQSNNEKTVLFENAKRSAEEKLTGIKFIEWPRDRKTILLSAVLKGERQYFILNTDNKNLDSLSSVVPTKFDFLTFNVSDGSELYGTKDKEVFRISTRAKTVSNVLETDVVYLTQSEGKTYYIKDNKGSRSLWQANNDMSGKTALFDAIPTSDSYDIKVSAYDGQIAILVKTSGMFYVLDKTKDNYSLSNKGKGITDFAWSPDGERVFLKGKDIIYVFDIKDIKEFEIPESSLYKNLKWYDSRHFVVQKGDKAIIMDFDGTNLVNLGSTVDGKEVFYSNDNRSIYFFPLQQKPEQTNLSIYNTEF